MQLSPQKKCMIETLYPQGDEGYTARELMISVGTNNPSDLVKSLRIDNNLTIKCKLIPITNRYGKQVYIGLYSIPESEREKALKLLASAETLASDKSSSIPKTTNLSPSVPQSCINGGTS